MYESFYSLNSRPFPSTPMVDRYFAAEAIENARQTITRNIERAAGPSLLVGPAGTGKSQLLHLLAEQLRSTYQIALLNSARLCTRRALLKNILFELDLPYHDREEGELRLALIDHLKRSDACASGAVMLVDEAHTLPLRLLEELRMITNLVHDGRPCVHLVLAGSHRLENRFADPRLESFSQRLAARCYLQAFNSEETREYVRAALRHVGAKPDTIFTHEALSAIYEATAGVPRLINQVADHAMILGSLGGHQTLDQRAIDEAWADLQQLPAPWNEDAQAKSGSAAIIEFGPLSDEDDRLEDETPAIAGQVHEDAPVPTTMIDNVIDDLDRLSQHVEAIGSDESDDDFVPRTVDHKPEVHLVLHPATDPFAESFDEEEIIIDRYASLDADTRTNRPVVTCQESNDIYEALHSDFDTSHNGQSEAATTSDVADSQLPPLDVVAVPTTLGNYSESMSTPAFENVPELTAYTTTDLPLENPNKSDIEHEDSHLFNELPPETIPVIEPVTDAPKSSPTSDQDAAIVESNFFDPAMDPIYPETQESSATDEVEVPTPPLEELAPVDDEVVPLPAINTDDEQTEEPPVETGKILAKDDRDIILIDDAEQPTTKAKREGYNQLFAKLRRV